MRKKATKILCLLSIVIIVSSVIAELNGTWFVDTHGNNLLGSKALKEIKIATKPLEGALTQERLGRVVQIYHNIVSDKRNLTDGYLNDRAWSVWAKYHWIGKVISSSYTDDFQVDVLEARSNKDMQNFYERYQGLIANKIIIESGNGIKPGAHAIANQIHTPFQYGYANGWSRFLEKFSEIDLFVLIAITICLVRVFVEDISYDTYDLICTTKRGYRKVALAKVKAVLKFITVFYVGSLGLLLLLLLLIIGFDGWKNSIQVSYLFCSRNYNYLQASVLILICGYFKAMLIGALSVYLSSIFKKAYISIAVVLLYILIPFIFTAMPNLYASGIMNKLVSIIPIQAASSILENHFYLNIVGTYVWSVYSNFILMCIAIFILFLLTIRAFGYKVNGSER